MNTRRRSVALAWVCASLVAPLLAYAQPMPASRLRCEYLVEPMCVGTQNPRLSWEVRDVRRGAVQTAYEVHVATTPELAVSGSPDVWNSGKVASGESLNVAYAGPGLRSGQRCYWTVRTWDGADAASEWAEPTVFTMGLLDPKEWRAKWIGDATPAPAPRPARNGFHTQFAESASDEKWVTIDLGEGREIDAVRLWPARPYDFKDTPGFCFPVRYKLLGSDGPGFEDARVLADRTGADAPGPGTEAVTVSFEPRRARYVRLVATTLRRATADRFALALAEMEVIAGGVPVSGGAKVSASDSIETGPWSTKNLTDGDLVSHNAGGFEALPAPMMRREFDVGAEVKRATLYITALGVYEASINGARVGDHRLAPEWTDYTTRVQYQAYDVTGLIARGGNAIGVWLGDGWYAGRLGMAQQFTPDKRPRAVYGRQPRLLAQLRMELADGSEQYVVTDESWSSTISGPIRSSDLLDGEVYDARHAVTGFDRHGYRSTQDEPRWGAAKVDDGVRVEIDPQMNEPIRAIGEIRSVGMTEPEPGVYVFDLGQNLPGVCRITARGDSGATVRLRHAEAVNDDGTIYTENLRGAPQVDSFVLAGDAKGETFEPRFTYHGFRFVEWTGTAAAPTIDSLVAVVVCTDAPVVSTFECSNAMLTKLWSNILWTEHANLMSVPTDCPQRDERLGWMGDILAFAQTASFNKDLAAFYAKWLRDVRDAQADDGRFPDVAPHPYGKNERFTGVPAWGDAGVFVPWASYQNYGDTRMLADHFEAATRWIDWIHSKNPDLLWKNNRHNDYNDWLNADTLIADGWPRTGGSVPNEILATAFFARSTWIVGQMAEVLGRREDAAKYGALYEKIRAAFQKAFVADGAMMPGDTQAGYALALGFDLLSDEQRPSAVANLVRGVEKYHNHLSTGFHSSHHAMIELTKAGHTDLAYTIATNTTFPSWGYSIENGSTTIWERWDGYVKGRGFQNPGMNSLNHWALGSVGEWMMRTIAGINPDERSPAWSHFTLRPVVGGGLTWAGAKFRSSRGLIESSWRIEKGGTLYQFTVPANTTAEIYLPDADPARVLEGGALLEESKGVRIVRKEPDGTLVLAAPAGLYRFMVSK